MRVLFIVRGFVQDVGYRWLVKRAAHNCNIKGEVKNAPDGSVHVLADGDNKAIELFKSMINVDMANGPQVKQIEEFAEGNNEFPTTSKTYEKFLIKD